MSVIAFRVVVVAVLLASVSAPRTTALAQSASAAPNKSTVEQLYTVLIFETPEKLAERTAVGKSDRYWTSYDEFAAALAKVGALRGGSALDEVAAVTVRGGGSADRGVVGARLGGYFVIAAPSRAAAEALARLAPREAVAVEVRPHRENPHMATTRK